MTTIIQTPCHAYQRKPEGYLIRNLESGHWTKLNGVDAMLLDIELAGCSLGLVDSVLARFEVQS